MGYYITGELKALTSRISVDLYAYDAPVVVTVETPATALDCRIALETRSTDNTKAQAYDDGYEPARVFYYGFRYYDSVTGRWPNRDPIDEYGHVISTQVITLQAYFLDNAYAQLEAKIVNASNAFKG